MECRICGCTDDDCEECIKDTGRPCYWVKEIPPLCSACVTVVQPAILGPGERTLQNQTVITARGAQVIIKRAPQWLIHA